MILNRAIKMRIYPDDEQRHKIDVTLGHCRYIYNKMLERNTVIYRISSYLSKNQELK